MTSSDITHQWVFLSVTTNKFLGINEFGKVCLEEECEGHCRFNIHGVSMPSAHLIIRLQNALNHKYFLQIDGPSPFQIDGFGGNLKQSKKSIFRYTSKVKHGQNMCMLQSVRCGFYISVKSSGEIYINQYADNRSSFYRFRIASNTHFNPHNAFNALPQFVKNIIIKNRIKNQTNLPIINNIKPSAPPAPSSTQYQVINAYNNQINEEIEGVPSKVMDSASFTTINNDLNELKIDINNSTENISKRLFLYGDDDENFKNRKFNCKIICDNKYDTPYDKHTIFTSILTNKNMDILPNGHITSNGENGPFSRFIIKKINLTNENSKYDTIIIQNTHMLQYLSINNIGDIEMSTKYSDIATHWKVIIKSQMLNGLNIVMLQSCLNQQLLAVNNKTIITSVPTTYMGLKNTQFIMNNIDAKYFAQKITKMSGSGFKTRSLTFEEKRFFYDFGFVIIKNVISPSISGPAIQFINDAISRNEHLKTFGPFGVWSCRERVIFNLYFQSNLYSIIQSLLGPRIQSFVSSAQIALRYPIAVGKKELKLDGKGWHIDGMLFRNATSIGDFSILVGIVLNGFNKEFEGNFAAYPRSHNVVKQLLCDGIELFMKKENDFARRYSFDSSQIKVKQIKACVGDIILCHPFLAHRMVSNYSKDMRYCVFMRPTRMDHKGNIKKMIGGNMWCEYEGLKEVIDYYKKKGNNKTGKLHQKSVSSPYIAVNPCYNFNTQRQYYEQQRIPAFNPHVYSQTVGQQQLQYQHRKTQQSNNNNNNNNNKQCSNTKYQKYSV